jgi:hypothetical protein
MKSSQKSAAYTATIEQYRATCSELEWAPANRRHNMNFEARTALWVAREERCDAVLRKVRSTVKSPGSLLCS